jgi:hypothetical protein
MLFHALSLRRFESHEPDLLRKVYTSQAPSLVCLVVRVSLGSKRNSASVARLLSILEVTNRAPNGDMLRRSELELHRSALLGLFILAYSYSDSFPTKRGAKREHHLVATMSKRIASARVSVCDNHGFRCCRRARLNNRVEVMGIRGVADRCTSRDAATRRCGAATTAQLALRCYGSHVAGHPYRSDSHPFFAPLNSLGFQLL